ncbi:MAG TPA: hypothetical protein VMM60_16050 [Ilumatobacter sp.]|nr:hypothetical protein [Ilumatobacter sp.]
MRFRGGAAVGAVLVAIATSTAGSAFPTSPVAAATTTTSAYQAVGPVRLADTRNAACGCTLLGDNTIRVSVTNRNELPQVPTDAVAAAVTVTALPTQTPGFITAFPGGSSRPTTSTLNTRTERVVANSAIIPLGADGTIDVFAFVDGVVGTDVVVDLTGVFVPANQAAGGRFVTLAPTRIADTRAGAPLEPGDTIVVPIPAGVDADATALAVNVTSVGDVQPGFVESWPTGQQRAETSFLNLNGSGQPVAAAAIQPVSSGGLTLMTTGGGHLVVDIVGWFTGPTAPISNDGLFVPLAPRRLLDSRLDGNRVWADGTVELPTPADLAPASSLVTNLTVVDADWRGFVTAFAAGTPRPGTSAVNAIEHDHTVANLAITPVSDRGLSYYSLGGTHLVVDATGMFTGTPVAAAVAPPPNPIRLPRVLIVGDSAMAALNVYTDSKYALTGFDVTIEADNCRRLVHPSCLSPATNRVPATALEAINAASGQFDIVYIDAGHNDWHDPDFGWQFDLIVQAARRKGAAQVLWATYTEIARSEPARVAYAENNANLRFLTSLPQYHDVMLADWNAYASQRPDWFYDGTHMTRPGAWGQTDYIARWIAAIAHIPCPRAWSPGAPLPNPCPHPDWIGPPADPVALY